MADRLLEGKVALVTGAGRGLGRAFAEHLASLGCKVGIHGMRENGPAEYGEGTTLTATAEEIGRRTSVQTCRVLGDLTDADQVKHCHQRRLYASSARSTSSSTTPVVTSRAVGGRPNPNDAVEYQTGRHPMRCWIETLLSTILVCQETAKDHDATQNRPNLDSKLHLCFKGLPNSSIYATAKAGVVEYTRCLAEQLRSHNINVNSLAPGDTRTGQIPWELVKVDDVRRMATEGTLDRIGMVDEVTRVVEFFAGPLGAFVTGQVLRVDGGSQIWAA
jgi:3-oxoacyl-[acyl-carrier protein] reductase